MLMVKRINDKIKFLDKPVAHSGSIVGTPPAGGGVVFAREY
jgi:hypothetical protein